MTVKITKKFALDEITKLIEKFVVETDSVEAGKIMTQMFDLGARAGMAQRNIETFILMGRRRVEFRLTGRV